MAKGAIKDWLALKNVVLPRDGKGGVIVKGAWQDKYDATLWHPVEHANVPADTTVRAGSHFQAHLDLHRVKVWTELGAVTSIDQTRDFDLEELFGDFVDFMGQKSTLADVLRACMIYTMEGVAEDEVGSMPFTEQPVRASDILGGFMEPPMVKRFIEQAKQLVNEKAQVEVNKEQ